MSTPCLVVPLKNTLIPVFGSRIDKKRDARPIFRASFFTKSVNSTQIRNAHTKPQSPKTHFWTRMIGFLDGCFPFLQPSTFYDQMILDSLPCSYSVCNPAVQMPHLRANVRRISSFQACGGCLLGGAMIVSPLPNPSISPLLLSPPFRCEHLCGWTHPDNGFRGPRVCLFLKPKEGIIKSQI